MSEETTKTTTTETEKPDSPAPRDTGDEAPKSRVRTPEEKARLMKRVTYAAPPLAVMLLMLVNFFVNKVWPFGTGTVAWCDMTQQVIPLLCDLKDILTFKSGVFLNFQNAGGMNMWGVIFFFVASPFSLLVVLVSKADMIYFANILVMLKLMACAFTAMVYLRRRVRDLAPVWACILAFSYALSGYGMLYFQNVIWLDMMYLFPLLLTAFGELLDHKRIWPYVAVLTAMMVVNYYIGYMVVVYILLFMGLWCFRYRKDKACAHAGKDFIIGSGLAAFLSGVVWLPSFIQYLGSGRKESFIEELQNTGFFARYQTTLPTIMHSVFVLVIAVLCMAEPIKRDKRVNTYLIMTGLLTIPLYIEPVNIMWHTGSYMSFPSRYGFMTQFVIIVTAALLLSRKESMFADREPSEQDKKRQDSMPVLLICAGVLYFSSKFLMDFVARNRSEIGYYSTTLWGNDKSFHMIIKLMIFTTLTYLFYYLLFKKKLLSREVFALLCAILVVIEGYNSLDIYMTMPNYNDPDKATDQRTVMDLSGKIQDDYGFYRVRTTDKLFDVNLVGAMGYDSLSHYTSLTSRDYMFMMKELGYSSYWMEVGGYGGTELTDPLLSVKYIISDDRPEKLSVYSNGTYTIDLKDDYLPMGLVVSRDKAEGALEGMERADIQQYLFENTLGQPGDSFVTRYSPDDETKFTYADGKYTVANGSYVGFTVEVKGRQSLYFDCFDELSNALTEPINDSFSVSKEGETLTGSYPTREMNGLLPLGTYENETVTFSLKAKKEVECASLGIMGLDLDKLDQARDSAKTIGFQEKRGTLTGSYAAEAGEKCILSVPYTEDLIVKINGKPVEYRQAFGDMVSIDLVEGVNDIKVSSRARGFIPGVLVTLCGIGLSLLYWKLGNKLHFSAGVLCGAYYLTIGLGIMAFIVIYVMPLAVNMTAQTGI